MKSKRVSQKKLNALIKSIIDILTDPTMPRKLKTQLEVFLDRCLESLPEEALKEIEILKVKMLLPEVLSRLQ